VEKRMMKRRLFLRSAAVSSMVLPLGYFDRQAFGACRGLRTPGSGRTTGRDYFGELGIKPFINAAAPYSSLSGAQMWPEVIEAMSYAAKRRARYKNLHDEVGKRVAAAVGSEAAMITAGAASGLTLGTAACMTGTNEGFIRMLPETKGLKNEVIIQKAHRYDYEHAVRNCGARLVEIETGGQCGEAINSRTAMMLYNYIRDAEGGIRADEFVAIGKKYRVPTLVDGAVSVPPAGNLAKLINLGFDLAVFSGGKGLRGPYSSGLLLGRRDLIEAAQLNSSPHDDTIGRGMKVGKEELLGMMVAVEISLKHDFEEEQRIKRAWLERVAAAVASIPSLKTEIFVHALEGNQSHLRLTWDESTVKMSPAEAVRALREGEPSVEVCLLSLTGGRFELTAWMMEEGEAETVAKRLKDVFSAALK
jgi:L-seryl-tRNA(Ser) seleniumtransferase